MTWKEILNQEKSKEVRLKLFQVLGQEQWQYKVYPSANDIFNALKHTPFDDVKVVVIGQDPYHGPGQAHGLCFSVKEGVKIPPSLRNIFKELVDDVGFKASTNGDLTNWAKQGVLLLNATWTVRDGQPNSHSEIGWRHITNHLIKSISNEHNGVVFLLWGAFAQEFEKLIDVSKHHVLKAPHPSPFSASRGFFGCKHFSKTNELLVKQNKRPIDWQL